MRVYTIDSVVVTVQKNSLNLNDKLNERTTCSFTVIDPTFSIEPGMEVTIVDDGNTVFAGNIENVGESGDLIAYVNVSCVDFSRLIDKRLVFDTFVDTNAGDIVKSIITDFFAEEGIIEGDVQDGPEIKRAVFNYDSGNISMNYLAEVTGFNWDINKDKQLNFFDRQTNTAPFDISDANRNYKNLQVKKTKAQYRNRQYVQAGTDLTLEIVKEKPTPKPDGVSKTFIVRLPIGLKPTIFVNDVAIDAANVGVNGIDQDKQYYFSYNSNTVTQDDSVTTLDGTDKIEITYQGLYPIFIVADNPSAINERQAVEGGSGIYENVVEEKTLDGRDAAYQFAFGKLDKYGIIPKIVTFDTYKHGLKSGQLLKVINAKHNVDGDFLIESIATRDDNGLTMYSVKCLDGSTLGGWEQFFKDLKRTQTQLVIREDEVLTLVIVIPEEVSAWSETLTLPDAVEDEETNVWDEELTVPLAVEDEETNAWQEEKQATGYGPLYPKIGLYPGAGLYPKKGDVIYDETL